MRLSGAPGAEQEGQVERTHLAVFVEIRGMAGVRTPRPEELREISGADVSGIVQVRRAQVMACIATAPHKQTITFFTRPAVIPVR